MNTLRHFVRSVLLGLGILALPAILRAQSGSSYSSMLSRIPQPPALPSDAQLLSQTPESFETSNDVNSLAQEIEGYTTRMQAKATLPENGATLGQSGSVLAARTSNTPVQSGEPTKGSLGDASIQSVPTTTITPMDTVLRLAHTIDLIARATARTYINADNAYTDKVNTANEHMRSLQVKEPCHSDIKCTKLHRRVYDLELVEAEKARVTGAASIISSEIAELLGPIRSLDELLPKT